MISYVSLSPSARASAALVLAADDALAARYGSNVAASHENSSMRSAEGDCLHFAHVGAYSCRARTVSRSVGRACPKAMRGLSSCATATPGRRDPPCRAQRSQPGAAVAADTDEDAGDRADRRGAAGRGAPAAAQAACATGPAASSKATSVPAVHEVHTSCASVLLHSRRLLTHHVVNCTQTRLARPDFGKQMPLLHQGGATAGPPSDSSVVPAARLLQQVPVTPAPFDPAIGRLPGRSRAAGAGALRGTSAYSDA